MSRALMEGAKRFLLQSRFFAAPHELSKMIEQRC
jgi:hypothetical protein